MRKPAFCICKNKGADQLHGNPAADQRLSMPLLPKSEISSQIAIFCGCTALLVSDLVGIPKTGFLAKCSFYGEWREV